MVEQVRVGVAVLVWKKGQILFHKRKGSHGAGTWSFPGGHMEYGENPFESVSRELKEECGVQMVTTSPSIYKQCPFVSTVFDPDEPEHYFHGYKPGKHYITLFFEVEVLDGEPVLMEPDKNEGWKWFDPDELPHPLFAPLHNGEFDLRESECARG